MNDTSRMKLQSVLSSLELEANNTALELENSHKLISNLEKEINGITNSFSESDIIFTPRKDHYPNEKLKQKRDLLKQYNQNLFDIKKKYDQLNDNIDMLVDVLSYEGDKASNKSALLFHEQDRQRIARDLHELAIQNLSYIVEKLDVCILDIDRNPSKAKMDLSMAKTSLNQTIDNIRNVVYDLRPDELESSNFKEEILSFINRFNEDKAYQIEADIDEISCDDQMILRTIVQIIQESFNNIKKHANAYTIHLIIQEQIGLYYIYIEDDGKGFDLDAIKEDKASHFGISIMKERVSLLGGNFSIKSSNNAGTQIKVLIPMAR